MSGGAGSSGAPDGGDGGAAGIPEVRLQPEGSAASVAAEGLVRLQPQGTLTLRRSFFGWLPPIQRAGMQLALWTGMLITAVTLWIIYDWRSDVPAIPTFAPVATAVGAAQTTAVALTATARAQADQATVDRYKAMMEIKTTRAVTLFDTIVGRALLPVFTGILGYIFGARAASAGEAGSSESRPEG